MGQFQPNTPTWVRYDRAVPAGRFIHLRRRLGKVLFADRFEIERVAFTFAVVGNFEPATAARQNLGSYLDNELFGNCMVHSVAHEVF